MLTLQTRARFPSRPYWHCASTEGQSFPSPTQYKHKHVHFIQESHWMKTNYLELLLVTSNNFQLRIKIWCTVFLHFHAIWHSKTNLQHHQMFIKQKQKNQIFSVFRTTCRRIQLQTESLSTAASEKEQFWQFQTQILKVQ